MSEMLKFTITNINVSLANAIRRTILMEIPCVIFKTFPYEENKANIIVNTSRLNNEILKQRLGCIPIHIKDTTIPIEDYTVIIHKKNTNAQTIYVTTDDFKIKHNKTDKYLDDAEVRKIFPHDPITNDPILFARLRGKIADDIPGEEIHIEATMSIGDGWKSGMFNMVSTCSYRYTVDVDRQETEWKLVEKKYKESGLTDDDIELEKENWYNHDAKRIVIRDSFDFVIETIGVFSNEELFHKSIDIIIGHLNHFSKLATEQKLEIVNSETTMENSFDITLKNTDYTIGKILEYMFHKRYFNDEMKASFTGFKKRHPHDNDSIIRVAFKEPTEKSELYGMFIKVCEDLILKYEGYRSVVSYT